MDKNKKKGLVVLVISIIVCIVGVSYAVFAFSKLGDKENEITTGTLILTLDESSTNGISLVNAIPVTDTEGLTYSPYTFSVKNTGTLNANYQLKLTEDTEAYVNAGAENKKLSFDKVKYSFTKNGSIPTTALLSSNNGIMDTTTIQAGATNNYTLRVWIDYDASNEIMGKVFYSFIELKAIQEGHTNYDTGE